MKNEVERVKTPEPAAQLSQVKASEVPKIPDWARDPLNNTIAKTPVISMMVSVPVHCLNVLNGYAITGFPNQVSEASKVKGPFSYGNIVASLGKGMIRGMSSTIASGQLRGACSVTSKQVHSSKESQVSAIESEGASKESQMNPIENEKISPTKDALMLTTVFSQVDLAFSQVANKGKLEANKGWKITGLRNYSQLLRMAYPTKTLAGFVNFGSLCVLSDGLTQRLPFSKDVNTALGGFISGATAAAITAIPDLASETIVYNTKYEHGQLKRMTTPELFGKLKTAVQQDGMKTSLKQFTKQLAKTLPIGVVRTGTIFGIISYGSYALGETPLVQVCSFFADKSKKAVAVNEVKAIESSKDSEATKPKPK